MEIRNFKRRLTNPRYAQWPPRQFLPIKKHRENYDVKTERRQRIIIIVKLAQNQPDKKRGNGRNNYRDDYGYKKVYSERSKKYRGRVSANAVKSRVSYGQQSGITDDKIEAYPQNAVNGKQNCEMY